MDTAQVRTTAEQLHHVATALGTDITGTGDRSGATGHDGLGERLRRFTADSRHNRTRLAEDVETFAAWCRQVADAVEGTEEQLAEALQNAPSTDGGSR
ncbi:hypothetical protein GCM10023225_08660 [Kineococcus glutinatus]|uniref:Excreted virulence factor EspC (Type VII ESX diderm) n=2 Tax=Kineococcus glutinatus TaxID=1070872 RepID=A0ABP9HDP2_9ACTN